MCAVQCAYHTYTHIDFSKQMTISQTMDRTFKAFSWSKQTIVSETINEATLFWKLYQLSKILS